jgi:hypothetical protein
VRERSTSCHVRSAFGRQMADRAPQVSASATRARSSGKTSKSGSHLSLAIDEFLDMDFGDISKSLSDLYKKLSLLWGRFWRTRPAEGDAAPSRGLLPGLAPFSTSKPQIQLCLRRGADGEGGTRSWLPPSGGPSRSSGTRSSPLIMSHVRRWPST